MAAPAQIDRRNPTDIQQFELDSFDLSASVQSIHRSLAGAKEFFHLLSTGNVELGQILKAKNLQRIDPNKIYELNDQLEKMQKLRDSLYSGDDHPPNSGVCVEQVVVQVTFGQDTVYTFREMLLPNRVFQPIPGLSQLMDNFCIRISQGQATKRDVELMAECRNVPDDADNAEKINVNFAKIKNLAGDRDIAFMLDNERVPPYLARRYEIQHAKADDDQKG